MSFRLTKNIIENIHSIALEAGDAIMKIYKTNYHIEIKSDFSPVTIADKNANKIIENRLSAIDSSIPILSEEGQYIEYSKRKDWEMFWLIDPLDGTKDFIRNNDEFTVNIALIKNNTPIFGVIYAPALQILYSGSLNNGAWKKENNTIFKQISCLPYPRAKDIIYIAGSRSHPSLKMDSFLSQFNNSKLKPIGSSLKICLVADGSVHLYPRLGPTKEWDTAAGHAILKASGGEMIQFGTNIPLKYNKKDLLNPEFISGSKEHINKLDYKIIT